MRLMINICSLDGLTRKNRHGLLLEHKTPIQLVGGQYNLAIWICVHLMSALNHLPGFRHEASWVFPEINIDSMCLNAVKNYCGIHFRG
jgi:hypothetical protein